MLRFVLPAALVLASLAGPVHAESPRAQAAAQVRAEAALEEVLDLRRGEGVRTGRELTEALRDLTLGFRHLRGEERARAAQQLDRPEVGGTRICADDFCVHGTAGGVLTTALVLAEAQAVHDFHTGTLGWREPPADDAGGDDRVDIYLDDVGKDLLFGYAQSDGGGGQSQSSFLVIDDDYSADDFGTAISAMDALRVTLAHEYAHVLQYGYDVTADGWHYESSATWIEELMYPTLEDWLRYVRDGSRGPGWANLTEVPLTASDDQRDQPRNAKPYGTAIWNHFLGTRYGDELLRTTWELSDGLSRPSTHAYNSAIQDAGGRGISSEFAQFAAAVTEWQLPNAGFPDADELPDVERRAQIAVDGAGVTPKLDHMTFALYDVPATDAPQIRFAASFPLNTRGAIALVAREGPADAGQVTTELVELPAGGTAGVTLDSPQDYFASGGRVTAVLVNADIRHNGFVGDDWSWGRDRIRVPASLTTDLTGPAVAKRSPAPDATRVGNRRAVKVTFDGPVVDVSDRTFTLQAPNGRILPSIVSHSRGSRTARLEPNVPLADATRYTVRLSDAIVDSSANPLAAEAWSFTTVERPPRAKLRVLSAANGAVRFALDSRDGERLRWTTRLLARGEPIASRRGILEAGDTRVLRMPMGNRRRARLALVLEDPQGNRERRSRRVGPGA
ncbi:MAG TPA: Ig-like domain-containing protein [Thermoleophilaceae bacterium]|nr:Ig-like domain-containing protein [Thermoleophilaceae bacterium]